jgi:hypothetical protein
MAFIVVESQCNMATSLLFSLHLDVIWKHCCAILTNLLSHGRRVSGCAMCGKRALVRLCKLTKSGDRDPAVRVKCNFLAGASTT